MMSLCQKWDFYNKTIGRQCELVLNRLIRLPSGQTKSGLKSEWLLIAKPRYIVTLLNCLFDLYIMFFYLFDSVVVCFFIIIMFFLTFVLLFICICISIFENLQFIHLDWHLYWVCSFCFCFLCFNDNLFLTRPQKPLPRLMKKTNRKCMISVYIKFSLFLLMAVIWSFRHLTGEVNG